jgi:chromate transporter
VILWQLFYTFFFIGSLAFGGGYVMIPLIDSQIVNTLGWLTPTQFIDIVAIAEMTPGPIAVNSATFVGFQQAGVLGSVVATTGVVLPSFLIVVTIAILVQRFSNSESLRCAICGVRPVVVGLIASAVWSVGKEALIDWRSWLLSAVMLVLLLRTKIHPILLIAVSGLLGLLFF